MRPDDIELLEDEKPDEDDISPSDEDEGGC
jgi:hypothetical protein